MMNAFCWFQVNGPQLRLEKRNKTSGDKMILFFSEIIHRQLFTLFDKSNFFKNR